MFYRLLLYPPLQYPRVFPGQKGGGRPAFFPPDTNPRKTDLRRALTGRSGRPPSRGRRPSPVASCHLSSPSPLPHPLPHLRFHMAVYMSMPLCRTVRFLQVDVWSLLVAPLSLHRRARTKTDATHLDLWISGPFFSQSPRPHFLRGEFVRHITTTAQLRCAAATSYLSLFSKTSACCMKFHN